MSSRSAKFVSAIVAGLLTGGALATTAQGVTTSTAGVADTCVSGPKGAAPQGGHWYYRIDRATKQHCWYIGEAKEKPAHAVAQNSEPSPEPATPPKNAVTRRSVANARAELPSLQTGVGQLTGVPAWQPPTIAANVIGTEDQRANPQDANTQRSVFASRWPEASSANSPTDPEPVSDDSGATEEADSTAAPTATLASVTLVSADAPSQAHAGSIQMLLVVILGALALAGLMGSAIFRFGNSRRVSRRDIRLDRRAIWDANADHRSPSNRPIPTAPMRKVEVPSELRDADDPNGRIEAMLARLARSAAH